MNPLTPNVLEVLFTNHKSDIGTLASYFRVSWDVMDAHIQGLVSLGYVLLDADEVYFTWKGRVAYTLNLLEKAGYKKPQFPAQMSTNEQLALLAPVATLLGFYDAADYLRNLKV